MKMVVLDGYTLNPGDLDWKELLSLGECRIYERTSLTDEEEIVRRIGDAEIVITNKTPISRNILQQCPGIKFIGVLATGYNVVDTDAARDRNIPVSNIPSYGTEAVAQFTIALLLEICHHIGHHGYAVQEGKWEKCPDFCFWDYPLIELTGKTIGIIGYGRIGQAVGRIATALGMKLIAYSAHSTPGTKQGDCLFVGMDELFRKADVISLHCPLFPATKGIINRESIAKMKDGVIIINSSRGPLIAEQDLRDALDSGKVRAAGMDVVSTEPIQGGNPLLGAKNCIITPHIAWAAKETRQRLMNIAVDNVKAFLEGNPRNVVNP